MKPTLDRTVMTLHYIANWVICDVCPRLSIWLAWWESLKKSMCRIGNQLSLPVLWLGLWIKQTGLLAKMREVSPTSKLEPGSAVRVDVVLGLPNVWCRWNYLHEQIKQDKLLSQLICRLASWYTDSNKFSAFASFGQIDRWEVWQKNSWRVSFETQLCMQDWSITWLDHKCSQFWIYLLYAKGAWRVELCLQEILKQSVWSLLPPRWESEYN